MSHRYAVFGHPVAHSLSPRIHAAFAAQFGMALEFVAMDAPPDQFGQVLARFAATGGRGASVTLPLKELALDLCAEVSARARRAGAVNTLLRHGDAWQGDNTDGIGLVHDLAERRRLDLRGRRVLLLGAGGAARGVAPALLDAGVGELWIVNRTPEKADTLADALGEPGRVHTRYWSDLAQLGGFDMLVNATSAGRGGGGLDLPFSLAGNRALAVDLNYGEAAVSFLAWAGAAGIQHRFDGLGMLVEQAAEAFALWHGKRPDTDEVYEALSSRADALQTAD
ncbi:shikimate dehydrogenase [Arenimonas fontis]|uniref:Shikimate dehydrogenase (NADP(+)) n=1 Tax=Arenimonas fontis TaxID=2608255 RepID=A0A5B2ZBX3_9GAMM|nr:shikimate dehydrogenase [Arenimonas fontis]KAA2284684.1 shikimate dehydrogenase [Arenimonas fontis]